MQSKELKIFPLFIHEETDLERCIDMIWIDLGRAKSQARVKILYSNAFCYIQENVL